MKKIKYISLILILGITTQFSYTQNLVPNSSFEIFTTCPIGASELPVAIPWQGVTTNNSDYYNACGTGGTNVPNGGGGAFQYAMTGIAFAGIWIINSYGGDYREYLQVKLDSTLQQDSCYLIEFYCNLHNLSRYAVDKMGAYLSNTAVNDVGPYTWGLVLQHTPQIISHNFLNDTLNWMRISGYYKANGGEQYISIGNFNTDSTTDTLHLGGSDYDGAYYYVDDVTVKKVAGCDTTASVEEYNGGLLFNLYPNPNNGKMLLNYSLNANDKAELLIYDITGKLISTHKLDSSSAQLTINDVQLSDGVYFYRIKVNDKIVRSDKLIIIK